MSSLVIFFTVCISVILSINGAKGVNIQDIDLDKILNLVQQQRLNRDGESDSVSSSSSESDSSDNDSIFHTSKVEEDNIIDILKQVVNMKNNKRGNRDRKINKDRSSNVIQAQIYDNGNSQRADNAAYILGQLLNNRLNVEPKYYHSRAKPPKKRLTPNRLIWNEHTKKADSLEDNSKIYIMLTPKAVQQTKSRSTINELVSKILSLSSSPASRNHQGTHRQKRYKGFAIRNNAGRRRGSREMYAPNDSAEDKPSKRGRSNGGGGHTAIPYIRHRGENIYEKDN